MQTLPGLSWIRLGQRRDNSKPQGKLCETRQQQGLHSGTVYSVMSV